MRALVRETPRDVALVSFDELSTDDFFHRNITVVLHPLDIGYRAVEVLLNLIEKGRAEGRRKRFGRPPRWWSVNPRNLPRVRLAWLRLTPANCPAHSVSHRATRAKERLVKQNLDNVRHLCLCFRRTESETSHVRYANSIFML